MRARIFWRTVTLDRSDLLDRFLALLRDHDVRYCLVGGQAVNAYVDPVVSLVLDLAVAAEDLTRLEPLIESQFRVERFPHSVNVSAEGSDLRIQIQTDPRYAEFPGRAAMREVLGLHLPVARVDDVLRGQVWAAEDPDRRASKRQKDLADFALAERDVSAAPARRPRGASDEAGLAAGTLIQLDFRRSRVNAQHLSRLLRHLRRQAPAAGLQDDARVR